MRLPAVWLAAGGLSVFPSIAMTQDPLGSEFRVNSYTTSAQFSPSLTTDTAGRTVIVWTSIGQDGSGYAVLGRRYDSTGAAIGSEFQVNSYTTGVQSGASVATDPNGNFVVVWHSLGQDGSIWGIFGRRFNVSGSPLGAEFQVNAYTTNAQVGPSIAPDGDGNFVVVWSSDGQDGSYDGIFGRRFNFLLGFLGSEFQVNSYSSGHQSGGRVAVGATGDFVVVWTSQNEDGSSYGIFGRRYDSAAVPLGIEFQVNSFTPGFQAGPSVGLDDAGNFVVVWQSYIQDGSDQGVFGRRFDSSANPLGLEFAINSYTTFSQSRPWISVDGAGNFVVVWQSANQDGSSYGIFGRRFDSLGHPQPEFQVNSYTPSTQGLPALATDSSGNFVVVWSGSGQGDNEGVFGRRLTISDLIFRDGLESGSLSAWSMAATDGGDLGASETAAMAFTTFGLEAVVNDSNSLYVQDDTPAGESRYRARFYFNPNSFDPGEADGHLRTRLLIASEDNTNLRLATVVLKRASGQYSLMGRVRLDDGSRASTAFVPITNGPHIVEFDWKRSSGPSASDGSFELWIDGTSVSVLSSLNNSASAVGFARLGALSVKTGAAGTMYFDEFESRRRTYIGPE